MACCLRTPIPVSEKKCEPMSENVNENGSKPTESPKKQAPKKPEKVYKYGSKAAYEPFFGEDVSVETMSDHLNSFGYMGDFWKNQRGVNGKLKYWYIECNHFPAVDKYLSDILDAAYKAAKTPHEKTKVADTHPVQEMLIAKPGTDKMVLPFWYISNSIKPPTEEDIIFNCATTIRHQADPPDHWVSDYQYINDQIEPDDRDLSSWREVLWNRENQSYEEIDPLYLLGLHNKEKELTNAGTKFAKKLNGPKDGTYIYLFRTPVLELGECCISADSKAYEIINFYHKECLKSEDLNRFGEYVSSLGAEPPAADEDGQFRFNTPSTLKNYRLPWEHLRILEETADYINQNTVDVIKQLIKKHCGDVVLGDVENALTRSESSLPAKQEKFNKWKLSLDGFENIGFYIPNSLEDVSDVAKQKAEKARSEDQAKALAGLTNTLKNVNDQVARLISTGNLASSKQFIDTASSGEQPGGSVVEHGPGGHKQRRVTSLTFSNWQENHRRIMDVMSDFAMNGFVFRKTKPEIMRVMQGQWSKSGGTDISLLSEDFVGYKLMGTEEEAIDDIIAEFNDALRTQLLRTHPDLEPRKLTREWFDYANQHKLADISVMDNFRVPDPRSLPVGSPSPGLAN
jgi:hypothetical protein